jgi:hypothetical protein
LKKFVAILLLCLYTFNLFGYLLFFHVLEQRAEQRLQTALDKEAYLESDLMTITVPLSLPYTSDTRDFERVDGEITLGGEIYHYVKRAVKNGAVVLKCLPNHQKMQLESAKQEFFKLAGDLQQTKPSQKDKDAKADLIKNLKAKYTRQNIENKECLFSVAMVTYYSVTITALVYSQSNLPDHPPELG